MEKSREYALERLDRWHSQRVERNYTPNLEREIRRVALEAIPKKASSEAVDIILKAVSREGLKHSPIFTSGYSQIEQSIALARENGYAFGGVPLQFDGEYSQPALKACEGITSFVEITRRRVDEIFPEELTDRNIDSLFVSAFGSREGYKAQNIALLETVMPLMDLQRRLGFISQDLYDLARVTAEAMKKVNGQLVDAIFPDIK